MILSSAQNAVGNKSLQSLKSATKKGHKQLKEVDILHFPEYISAVMRKLVQAAVVESLTSPLVYGNSLRGHSQLTVGPPQNAKNLLTAPTLPQKAFQMLTVSVIPPAVLHFVLLLQAEGL